MSIVKFQSLDDKTAKKVVLNLFVNPTKKAIEAQIQQIADQVKAGEISAMKVAVACKIYDRLVNGDTGKKNGLMHRIASELMGEVEKFKATEEVDYYGAKFAVRESGTKYDYSNDPIWQGINFELEAVKERLKKHEEKLKALMPRTDGKHLPTGAADFGGVEPDVTVDVVEEWMNPKTGEMYTPKPPMRTSSQTTFVTLKAV